jgi:signal transduction histidine kinase
VIAFQPRARLLKLIGEELISDEVVALAELVKNAHDADASQVTVTFRGVTAPGGALIIHDDGTGMDLETLLGRWMEPAASTKVGNGRQLTRRGRRVLGEKGVGRFAADKLARQLEIVTRCRGSQEETHAVIDWDRFDTPDLLLSQVKNRWEVRPAQELSAPGTVLRMTGLRGVWTERMFRRLCIRLSRLLSPFRAADPFTIRIESDEFPDYSGEVRADFLTRAPYRIEATFDGRQTIALAINGRGPVEQRWNGHGELTCGPVRVRLYVFDLEAEALARMGPRMEVRAWLREWTGVSLYRDGFRVWPYGEPHDDWLRLDQRRVNNPVEHLSNNQVIGFIDITRDANPDLKDQTNREGLVHTPALDDLRRLVYFVLQAIEAERQLIRHPARRPTSVLGPRQPETQAIAQELGRIADRLGGEDAQALRQLQRRVQEAATRDQVQQQDLIEGHAGLAATGQMAAGLLPLVRQQMREMQREVERLRSVLGRKAPPGAREALDALGGSLDSIEEYHRLMLAASGNTERRRAIDIVAEIRSYREFVAPLLGAAGVEMEIRAPATQILRAEMRPENFYGVLHILTSNALDWLRGVGEPRIRVAVTAHEVGCEIIFSDNGPGLSLEVAERMFDPLFSGKEGGRGMGLTIARQLIRAHGGSIGLIVDGRRRGANFQILLPRKRSRATLYNGR